MNGKRFQSVHSKYIAFRRRYIHEKDAELAVGRGRKIKEEKERGKRKERKIEKNRQDISKVSRRRRRRENKDPIDSAFGIWQSPCDRG